MKRGDLFQITDGNPKTHLSEPLSEEQVWDIARPVLQWLKYLYDNNIVHGDIKPQNILVNDDGRVKIADFGINKMLGAGEKQVDTAGTPAFMSPELCAGKAYNGQLADLYAIGATLFCLRQGYPPFVCMDRNQIHFGKNKLMDLYHRIQNDPVTFKDDITEVLKLLIVKLMEKDPALRLTMIEAFHDPWLKFRPGTKPYLQSKIVPMVTHKKYAKVEVTNDEIFNSIHEVQAPKMKEREGYHKCLLSEENSKGFDEQIEVGARNDQVISSRKCSLSRLENSTNQIRHISGNVGKGRVNLDDSSNLLASDDIIEDMSEDVSLLDGNFRFHRCMLPIHLL